MSTTLKKMTQVARVLWNIGPGYACPICGYRSRKLQCVGEDASILSSLVVVGGGRREVGCYLCGSTDRERLIYLYLKKHSGLSRQAASLDVLHIAPERHVSRLIRSWKPRHYIRGDLHAEGYALGSDVEPVDISELPYSDGSFNLIICNHVLEQVYDDAQAMRELLRVLRPAGIAILQVPISMNIQKTIHDPINVTPQQRLAAYGQEDHVRLYGLDYFDRLESAGFCVERVDLACRYPKNGLNPRELLVIGRR